MKELFQNPDHVIWTGVGIVFAAFVLHVTIKDFGIAYRRYGRELMRGISTTHEVFSWNGAGRAD